MKSNFLRLQSLALLVTAAILLVGATLAVAQRGTEVPSTSTAQEEFNELKTRAAALQGSLTSRDRRVRTKAEADLQKLTADLGSWSRKHNIRLTSRTFDVAEAYNLAGQHAPRYPERTGDTININCPTIVVTEEMECLFVGVEIDTAGTVRCKYECEQKLSK